METNKGPGRTCLSILLLRLNSEVKTIQAISSLFEAGYCKLFDKINLIFIRLEQVPLSDDVLSCNAIA